MYIISTRSKNLVAAAVECISCLFFVLIIFWGDPTKLIIFPKGKILAFFVLASSMAYGTN